MIHKPENDCAASNDVAIIGAGAAGATAARTLVRGGHPGPVLVFTAEEAQPYDRTELSKAFLTGDRKTPTPLFASDLSDDRVTVRTGVAVTVLDVANRMLTLADGSVQRYDTLLLATGAAPRRLDIPGADLGGIHLVRELSGAPTLRKVLRQGGRLVVIGGGLIGLEVAAAARSHECDVTVIETAGQVLGRVVPSCLAEIVAAEHRANLVQLELGVRPAAFVSGGNGRVAGVELEDGRCFPAEAVVVAVGVGPRTELAEAAGLQTDDGVIVDRQLRTSEAHVLAAGDLVRIRGADGHAAPRTEAWTPAMAMGRHAANTILGASTPYLVVPSMWSDQYDLRIQAVGSITEDCDKIPRGAFGKTTGVVVFGLDATRRVRGIVGISRGGAVGATVRAGLRLIQHAVEVDPAQLADPAVDLRSLLPPSSTKSTRRTSPGPPRPPGQTHSTFGSRTP